MTKFGLLLISIFHVLRQVNGSCEDDFNNTCLTDPICAPIAEFYLEACQPILNGSVTSGNCSDECKYGLTSYLKQTYDNADSTTITDYCTCDESGCYNVSMTLQNMGCIDTTILDDCPSIFNYQCMGIQNETCGPIGMNYIESCQLVFNGTITSGACPYDCSLGLTAYLDYMWPNVTSSDVADYCSCGDDIGCSTVSGYLQNMGCINYDSCEYAFEYRCMSDPECAPIGEFYLEACQPILNGSLTTGNCSDECKYGLTAYLNYMWPGVDSTNPDDYCTCAGAPGCDSIGDILQSMGCIDETILNDCPSIFNYQCMGIENETCGPIGMNYIEACQLVFNGTITSGECPYDCSLGLTAYLDYMWPNINSSDVADYCSCGDDIGCSTVSGYLQNMGCIDDDSCEYAFEYTCMSDPECAPIGEFYLESCQAILNGSLTSGTCPDECKYGLTSYLNYMWPDVDSTNPDDYCTCAGSPGCDSIGDILQSMGCIDKAALNDCASVFQYQCMGIDNETCGPIGENYLDACSMILNGSMTSGDCPYDCQLGLTAYLDYMWPNVSSTMVADYCTCSDSGCSNVSMVLEDTGCIVKNECGYIFNAVCMTDPDCAPIGLNYLDECQYILNGSVTSGICTDDCRWALTGYLDYVWPNIDSQDPDAYCSCSASNPGDCDSVGDILQSMGCIDKNDCAYVFNKCLADTDCASIATQYFADCSQFIDMSYDDSLNECPAACQTSLMAYLEYIYGDPVPGQSVDEYCNCNGQTECVTITGWYDDLGCGEIPLTTTEEPTTAEPTTAEPTTAAPSENPTMEPTEDDGTNPTTNPSGIEQLTIFGGMMIMMTVGLFM